MLTNPIRPQLVIGIWLAALTAIVALSVALGAGWSTTALLVAMSAAPMGIARLLGFGGGRSMTTHELLHAIDNQNEGRS
jgi:fatty acid desaturase